MIQVLNISYLLFKSTAKNVRSILRFGKRRPRVSLESLTRGIWSFNDFSQPVKRNVKLIGRRVG